MANERKVELLADWLERQVADSQITDGRIWQDLAVSERTFYRLKPKALELMNQRLAERQKQVEQVKTHEAIEVAKKGLKTKNERLLILQGQVDEILIDLKSDKLSLTDKAYLRKTLKDIQAEISKIEGDYAPDRSEIDHKNIPFSDSQVDKIIQSLRENKAA